MVTRLWLQGTTWLQVTTGLLTSLHGRLARNTDRARIVNEGLKAAEIHIEARVEAETRADSHRWQHRFYSVNSGRILRTWEDGST